VGNGISDVGAKALFTSLQMNNTIKNLNLDSNNITDASIGTISTCLKRGGCSLKTLSLQNNKIGDAGAKILNESIRSNTSLLDMPLLGNSINTNSDLWNDINRNLGVNVKFVNIRTGMIAKSLEIDTNLQLKIKSTDEKIDEKTAALQKLLQQKDNEIAELKEANSKSEKKIEQLQKSLEKVIERIETTEKAQKKTESKASETEKLAKQAMSKLEDNERKSQTVAADFSKVQQQLISAQLLSQVPK